MSPRRNWDSPTPPLASECAPPPEPKGGGGGRRHTQFLRLEKKHSAYSVPGTYLPILAAKKPGIPVS